MIASLRHILTLVEVRRPLVIRFVVTSLGRSLLSMATILLVREFLGGILASDTGLSGRLADYLGPDQALYAVAAALMFSYTAASLLVYDTQVTQQRMVRSSSWG